MMADFVNENVSDDVAKRFLIFRPVIQNGTAVDCDPVGLLASLQGKTLPDTGSFKKAKKSKGDSTPYPR